jgi:phospholipid/cholesterol/gamma-HCH transport system permease protein
MSEHHAPPNHNLTPLPISMIKSEKHGNASFEITEAENRDVRVAICGRMDHDTSGFLIKSLCPEIKRRSPERLTLVLDHLAYFDDFGALAINELQQVMDQCKGALKIDDPLHITDSILSFIDLKAFQKTGSSKPNDHWVERIGQGAMDYLKAIRTMVSFVGSVFLSFLHAAIHSKSLRFSDIIVEMEKTGVNALPIVSLISFLLGLVMAFMSSLQLKQFGANIYVASLVALAMVSELGPIMTAIVVAGRSGSAFAAEIGTMKIYEEVDALSTMGFDPVLFLAVPRMIASMVVVPLLTIFSGIFGILGGLSVGVTLLDLTASSYISQTLDILTLFEILWSLMKSIVFAAIISWVGCLRGFQARGGADAVGNAATSAVVTSIFLIILSDSFFAILRSYWW